MGTPCIEKVITLICNRYVCGHANQARITQLPTDDEDTMFGDDVITFAREAGYYSGTDEDFSFSGNPKLLAIVTCNRYL